MQHQPIEAVPSVTQNLFTMTNNTGVQTRRTPKHGIFPIQQMQVGCRPGGGKRDRTDDLLLAKQALSQLSYAPV